MLISWHTDYDASGIRIAEPAWPNDWPVPRIGDEITNQDGKSLRVTAVVWYPYGEDGSNPFVYVVTHA